MDLRERATDLVPDGLILDRPGLKVLAFHPNLIFLNAMTVGDYEGSREHYHDPDWLRSHRRDGRGVRTLFLELLDRLARGSSPPTLAEVNAQWRADR